MFLVLYVSPAVQNEEAFAPLSFSGKKRYSTTQEDTPLRADTPPWSDNQEQARSPGSQVEASKKISTPARMLLIPDSGGFRDDGVLSTIRAASHEDEGKTCLHLSDQID